MEMKEIKEKFISTLKNIEISINMGLSPDEGPTRMEEFFFTLGDGCPTFCSDYTPFNYLDEPNLDALLKEMTCHTEKCWENTQGFNLWGEGETHWLRWDIHIRWTGSDFDWTWGDF